MREIHLILDSEGYEVFVQVIDNTHCRTALTKESCVSKGAIWHVGQLSEHVKAELVAIGVLRVDGFFNT
jgi:hypothetical protein